MSLHKKFAVVTVCLMICQACIFNPQKYRSASSPVIQSYTQLYATLCYKHKTHGQGRVHITLHLQANHCIWFSIKTPWGLELVRGKMTPKQVSLLYPMRKTYTICSYEELQKQWPGPWTYDSIQALILGEMPHAHPTKQQPADQPQWQYQGNAPDQVTELMTMTTQGPLKVSYSYPQLLPKSLPLWKKIFFEAYSDHTNKALMTVTLSQHKNKIVQGPIKAPFDIPEHYVPQ